MCQNASAVDPLQWIWKKTQIYRIDHLKFSPDDKYILVQGYPHTTEIVETATGTTIFSKEEMSGSVWSKDGRRIFALQGNPDGIFCVTVETGSWKTIDSFWIASLYSNFSISEDEHTLALAGSPYISFYDLITKKKIKSVAYYNYLDYPKPNTQPTIFQMVWSKDNRYIIYSASTGPLNFWDVEKDKIIYSYPAGGGYLDLSDDGSKIAFSSGKKGYAVEIMDIATKQIVAEVMGASYDVTGIGFSPDVSTIAVAFGFSSTLLNIYRLANVELKAQAKYSSFRSCVFSHNNKYLTSSVADILYLFDVREILSVGGERVDSTLELYPIPVTNILKVNTKGNLQGIIEIDIVNITGNIVKTLQKNSFEEMTIDVSDIPSGTYTLVMACGKTNYKIRFIKL